MLEIRVRHGDPFHVAWAELDLLHYFALNLGFRGDGNQECGFSTAALKLVHDLTQAPDICSHAMSTATSDLRRYSVVVLLVHPLQGPLLRVHVILFGSEAHCIFEGS